MNQRFGKKANIDQLTGLYNRNYLMTRLTQDVASSQHKNQPFALIFLDLDGFKYVNDSLGHALGDALLCEVARRLRSKVRASDVLARLGGDEFVVILGEVNSPEIIEQRAEAILQAINQIHQVDGYPVEISCSIGISLFPDDAQDVETMLKYADTAMYEAKAAGKNMIQFYQPKMQHDISKMVAVHNALKKPFNRMN
ncbi:GGDEF domain-containing protein [methane-oxidizing endosymbiont of Gigantopelta aegis]|uniref:GGDEF domain-containing protein n=1 Tax=methane-oxidizing endosymbiont of Gigantopelta aegis TaxID=2794938 RepID=UPI0018DE45B3|nr:GGDEF domain-containing protein [methane-oxidizing endosymbiont of Gigantopelta aegis]